jgi:uncharacterized sulfatase
MDMCKFSLLSYAMRLSSVSGAVRILLAVFILFGCNIREERSDKVKPNILFAISDDQSYPHASAYGASWVQTPAFDRIARTGVLLNNAFVAAPQCSPNRAAILTGRNIGQLEEAGTHASYFPKKFTVFTDLLEERGYQLGYTGKPWGPGNWQDAGWERNPVGPEYNELSLEEVPADGINPRDYFGNFIAFYQQKEPGKPFFFWYGAHEPHRRYEAGSGLRHGKELNDVEPPGFLPEDSVIRADLLDYALEIEWFDYHLGRMIEYLANKGELDNTLIVVTADNGMPFPGAKANLTEYGTHVPMAISWPNKVDGGKITDALLSHVDLAPTFLDAAGIQIHPDMTGTSFMPVLLAAEQSVRDYVITGRERHTHARPDNLGYPARGIRTDRFLYIWNVKPDRWPAGDPVEPTQDNLALDAAADRKYSDILPGYHDIDNSPSKSFMMEHRDDPDVHEAFVADFEKRPGDQLFDIKNDPACVNNLAHKEGYQDLVDSLRNLLKTELTAQGDPRVTGMGDVFESYPRISRMRPFPGFKEQGQYNPAYQQGQ